MRPMEAKICAMPWNMLGNMKKTKRIMVKRLRAVKIAARLGVA